MGHETLRTTPRWMHGRDVTLFPEARQAERERGCPRHYAIRVTRSRVCFTFDALFLPPDIEAALDGFYRDYLTWWLAKDNPARQRTLVWPSHLSAPRLRDGHGVARAWRVVARTVPREPTTARPRSTALYARGHFPIAASIWLWIRMVSPSLA